MTKTFRTAFVMVAFTGAAQAALAADRPVATVAERLAGGSLPGFVVGYNASNVSGRPAARFQVDCPRSAGGPSSSPRQPACQ